MIDLAKMVQTELKLLERELQVFSKVKEQLCERYTEGGYIVINNHDILGIWDEREVAIAKAINRYGLRNFLVKNIKDEICKNSIVDHLSLYQTTFREITNCYISPTEKVISYQLKKLSDFPLLSIKTALSNEIDASFIDTNIIKKMSIPAWDIKKVDFKGESFLMPCYDVTIRFYGCLKKELTLQVVALDLSDELFDAILTREFLLKMSS